MAAPNPAASDVMVSGDRTPSGRLPCGATQDSRPERLSLIPAVLTETLRAAGVPTGHAGALFGHLHRRRAPAETFPGLTAAQRERLLAATRPTLCELVERHVADDATEKLVFALEDARRVEGVIIPEGVRSTFCVSSQVGCAMGCAYCATARLGLERGLTPGEIVAQVHCATSLCAETGRPLRNVVFMGMGEPLQHYEATRTALQLLTDPHGPCLAHARITVSTVGLPARIRQLGVDFGGRIQLALSLNAGTEATRRRLMPMAHHHDLASLHAALADYPRRRNRFLMVEYVLLRGLTDTEPELLGLAAFVADLPAVVNLIPWNPFPDAPPDLVPPPPADLDRVFSRLRALGVVARVRLPRGRHADAACGQLARLSGRADTGSENAG